MAERSNPRTNFLCGFELEQKGLKNCGLGRQIVFGEVTVYWQIVAEELYGTMVREKGW